jgi:S-adenosylmethionine hydrolase
MPETRVVTFTTDFGMQDPFVGIMHGVVLNIQPDVHIVDISHAVRSFDILDGAFTIAQAYRFFPPRSVHVIVIDPGVGSERRPIVVETENYLFIAPDNGVLTLVEAREPQFTVRQITAERYFLQPVSQTFHGRDVFSPVAAWLAKGVAPADLGPAITDYVRLPIAGVSRSAEGEIRAAVLKVDKFGNLITNLTEQDLSSTSATKLKIAGHLITRICHSYAEGETDDLFAIFGSSGYLEIAAKQDSAAKRLGAREGEPVSVVIG